MAMLRGWRRQRANLIFAPLAMPLPLLPADPSLSLSLLHFPPAALTVCVSLTHNSRALFIPLSRLPVRYAGRRVRFSTSSTLAYFTQSILLDIYTRMCTYTHTHTLPLSLSISISLNLSINLIRLKVRYKLSLRRDGVNSLKYFVIEYS